DLPESLIAQLPAAARDASRLMVINRTDQSVTHTHFHELCHHVPAKTRFFRNSAAVFKARLRGQRASGGAVECLLLHPDRDSDTFWCLLKPGKKLPIGTSFSGPGYEAAIISIKGTGERLVQFKIDDGGHVIDLAERVGEMPLPPYIERSREADPALRKLDEDRYQTVYADREHKVAAAAPTAGLHFTPELINEMEGRGADFHDIRLHVGLDTFQPVKSETIEGHTIHRELYEIPPATQQALHTREGGLRLCVGTTSVRACEDYLRRQKQASGSTHVAEASLYLYPPAEFLAAEAMITNFHLPRSTLLCLVAAFLTPGDEAGISWLKEIYAEAVGRGYRFYSYGDAMLIL
ncbi:MAG: tRNA preQ1(34) S-adenosylmethionine ribosyltransferase-isomerase QueA, partial [Verrucomicrobiota bacterium]